MSTVAGRQRTDKRQSFIYLPIYLPIAFAGINGKIPIISI
ncbi:hypothetical protein AO368_1559 [Moraxella catarrhalis]|nr:hypothetical protein AO371_0810 [Moraxella catarrhalis]OAV27749.1 hypothetical protein AO368_1559 [Moraxella catarrhalis]